MVTLARCLLLVAFAVGLASAPGSAAADVPAIRAVAGPMLTFATHADFASNGYVWGPSDGPFGAIPIGGGRYTFYGTGGSAVACTRPGGPYEGAATFTGTLDKVSGGDGCRKLFGPGAGPAGWTFTRNYAGGGQVVRFASGGKSGWLMPFHGEFWWQNPATPNHKCLVAGGAGSSVDCFYSSLGLAVSSDDGKNFKVVGEILQPSLPRAYFMGSGTNMAVGYGSLVVADANGRHLDNPPPDPSVAYFYLFYTDFAPSSPGVCAQAICMGVARAGYADLVAAALSGDPHRVAKAFHKYNGAAPDPWTQPATSDTLDDSGQAGTYAPLWTNEPGSQAQVLYDRAFDVYLAAYGIVGRNAGIKVRASKDLIHWSGLIGDPITLPGSTFYYPTLLGETGDPTIGGPAPRVYFSSFPVGQFPDWKTATFESVPLMLSSP